MPTPSHAIEIPEGVAVCGRALVEKGGRVFLVGGAVRDAMLGRDVKDYDLEVFGLSGEAVVASLSVHRIHSSSTCLKPFSASVARTS